MDIRFDKICKSFGDLTVLRDFSAFLEQGKTYVLTGVSGSGKTTLLRILLGLEQPDSGTVTGNVRCTAVFQEDRLLPGRTAVENLMLIAPKGASRETLKKRLSEILPTDCLDKPIEKLSGGMKRRVAIARAMLPESECVVMDEPFTGLDEAAVSVTLAFIYRHLDGRTLLLSTHQPEALQNYPTERLSL